MLQLVSEQIGLSGQASNVVYPFVRDKCVQHCRYLLLSHRLFAGVGLKQVGEKLVLLLDVSSVNNWFGVL